MLSSSEIDQYYEDGYLIPNFRLGEQTLSNIKSAHSQLVERHPEFVDYCPAILPYDRNFLEFARNEIGRAHV